MQTYHELSFDLLFIQTTSDIFLIPWRELCSDNMGKMPRNLRLGKTLARYRITEPLVASPMD